MSLQEIEIRNKNRIIEGLKNTVKSQNEKVERYEKALETIMKDSELVNGIHGKISYSYPGKVAKKALEG
ncbi:hypothetical protein [Bacillus xiapuensis]|uniref:Uncharacterized protein n=1 Tax=Bacillus xiapuensis TaxID=2014075 RepID=A0ABU6N946_9BACI|nr:hypothetical protein [Bacillus xiapuensis]